MNNGVGFLSWRITNLFALLTGEGSIRVLGVSDALADQLIGIATSEAALRRGL
jgi:hypothetical protein